MTFVAIPGDYYVIGFECTAEAIEVYKDKCPLLGRGAASAIESSGFDLESIWTLRSLAISRAALLALWLMFFVLLSIILSSFLVYQIGRR